MFLGLVEDFFMHLSFSLYKLQFLLINIIHLSLTSVRIYKLRQNPMNLDGIENRTSARKVL